MLHHHPPKVYPTIPHRSIHADDQEKALREAESAKAALEERPRNAGTLKQVKDATMVHGV